MCNELYMLWILYISFQAMRLSFIHNMPHFTPALHSLCLQVDSTASSFLVTLSFAYSLLGRRMFFQHAQSGASRRGGDNFMNGLYRMFLGDARPNSPNDEWVFTDVDSIQDIIIPASRLALKVHQVSFITVCDLIGPCDQDHTHLRTTSLSLRSMSLLWVSMRPYEMWRRTTSSHTRTIESGGMPSS